MLVLSLGLSHVHKHCILFPHFELGLLLLLEPLRLLALLLQFLLDVNTHHGLRLMVWRNVLNDGVIIQQLVAMYHLLHEVDLVEDLVHGELLHSVDGNL